MYVHVCTEYGVLRTYIGIMYSVLYGTGTENSDPDRMHCRDAQEGSQGRLSKKGRATGIGQEEDWDQVISYGAAKAYTGMITNH